MELLQSWKGKCLCNDCRTDGALLESCFTHLCWVLWQSGAVPLSVPLRLVGRALQVFHSGLQLLVPTPLEADGREIHGPAGGRERGKEANTHLPLLMSHLTWVAEGAAGSPSAAMYVANMGRVTVAETEKEPCN